MRRDAAQVATRVVVDADEVAEHHDEMVVMRDARHALQDSIQLAGSRRHFAVRV